jgi:drug/metabolite transporter (DMT)-like permease
MKNEHLRHLVLLNIALLLISTSGVLGRSLELIPPVAIWWRCLFAAVLLGAWCIIRGIPTKPLNRGDRLRFLMSGLFLGAHWVTYFYALKYGNVAIGMLSLFTYPVITAFIEPLFFRSRIDLQQVVLGLVVLLGVYLLIPEFSLDNDQTKGVLFGVLSALCYTLRNILSKKHVAHYNGSAIMFLQVSVVVLLTWPVLFLPHTTTSVSDWQILVTLALVTTVIGHTLFVTSFKHFTVTTASIMSSVQPVWGILLGMVFLAEIPSGKTFFGGLLILITVVLESIKSKSER